MRNEFISLSGLCLAVVAFEYTGNAQGRTGGATPPASQGAQGSPVAPAARGRGATPRPVFKLEDNFLNWRLLSSEKQYEAIDGKKMLGYVSDLAAISRRYRDSGHPQFWGRVIGTSADR